MDEFVTLSDDVSSELVCGGKTFRFHNILLLHSHLMLKSVFNVNLGGILGGTPMLNG